MMRPDQPLISRVAADVLTGYYKRKRLTQEELAVRSEIPLTSLQKKLKGKAPITATDLVMLSRAIGIDPAKVMAEIVEEAETAERQMSEGIASISEHRNKKTPATMTDDELEAERSAANTDPEHLEDEPDLP
jgi:transcriptional regulator with XRE-family HTH domain